MTQIELFDRYHTIMAVSPDGETRNWDGIDFSAGILKTENTEPNEVEITVYNLNADSRSFMARPGTTIEIDAGYKQTHGIIFRGQIDNCTNTHNRNDWETKITALDGARAARSAKISQTFKSGTQHTAIFNALVSELTKQIEPDVPALTAGNIDLSIVSGSIIRPVSLSGLAFERLSQLCRSWGLHWYVVDGALHIVKSNLSINSDLIELNKKSGLIGRPEQTETGYKVMSLLRHEFQPGIAFNLNSVSVQSRMLIESVEHTAETRGDWVTKLECRRI